MKPSILSLLLAALYAMPLQAQAPWFNDIQDYGLPINSFRDIAVVGDTIIGVGLAYPDSFDLRQGILVVRLDSSGNFLDKVLFQDSLGGHLFVPTNSGDKIVGTRDGGYAFVCASVNRNDAFLYKLDRNLQVEFIRTFVDTVDLGNFPYSLLETRQGYLLYGNNTDPNYSQYGFLHHVDAQGNTLWHKKYAYNGTDNYVMDVDLLNDSVFVAATWINVDGNVAKYKSSLRKMHLNGTQLGYWESGVDAPTGAIKEILTLPDGGVVAHGASIHLRNNVLTQLTQVKQMHCRFDSNFQMVWLRNWHKPDYLSYERNIKDMFFNHAGKVLSVGDGVILNAPGDPDRWAGIGSFTVTGDSLWFREVYPPYPINSLNSKRIYGGGLLSSGSIVAGGEARIGWAYYAWILKLSKDGCLDTLFACEPVSVSVPPPLVRQGPLPALALWPNPAHQSVRVSFPSQSGQGLLRLFHPTGREVLRQPLWLGEGGSELLLGDCPAGVYLVVLETSDGRRATARLVVE